MPGKAVRVVLSQRAEEAYLTLPRAKPGRSIAAAVRKKAYLMKSDPHHGDPISKSLIPREYVIRYKITNLFRIELPNFWRLLYTLTEGEDEKEIVAFVLDIVSHEEYDRLFGYRGR